MSDAKTSPCPICSKLFSVNGIEEHVNKCLFLNEKTTNIDSTAQKLSAKGLPLEHLDPCVDSKRLFSENKHKLNSKLKGSHQLSSPLAKKMKLPSTKDSTENSNKSDINMMPVAKVNIPLAEKVRPKLFDEFIGQTEAFGNGSMLRDLLINHQVSNMILWGPPGCGKTSLANIIGIMCKEQKHLRFVKLSATMAGLQQVKEVMSAAQGERQFQRQTILFIDEIHRFSKTQQDALLPHVESGLVVLVGATTENPSFSVTGALLSRCRVVPLQPLSVDEVVSILRRAVLIDASISLVPEGTDPSDPNYVCNSTTVVVEEGGLRWLAECSGGDARVALGALETALAAARAAHPHARATLTLQYLKNGIKRSQSVYDRSGDERYQMISALHKSVRASQDSAALYWVTRMLHAGEDPLYIARRLVRIAAEDVGLGDPSALGQAVSCLEGCRHVGLPECDVLLAQTAVYLARAPKSTEVYQAMKRCQRFLETQAGAPPPVPLCLRNASTPLMAKLGYGVGYNTLHHESSGLTYMPEGLENVNFFKN